MTKIKIRISHPQTGPFFIFYDSRSGSTLLARLLVEKLNAVIPPESRFLPEFLSTNLSTKRSARFEQFLSVLSTDNKFEDWGVSLSELESYLLNQDNLDYTKKELLDALIYFYLHKSGTSPLNVKYFGFKKGNYQYHTSDIVDIYPQAKFICLIRDGRAVFNSKRNSLYWETGLPFETDLLKAAKAWTRCVHNFELILNRYCKQTILIRYEDVVTDPDTIIVRLGRFLQFPPTTQTSKVSTYEVPERYGDLHRNIYKSPISSRINAWQQKLTLTEIGSYESVAGQALIKYGYEMFALSAS